MDAQIGGGAAEGGGHGCGEAAGHSRVPSESGAAAAAFGRRDDAPDFGLI